VKSLSRRVGVDKDEEDGESLKELENVERK